MAGEAERAVGSSDLCSADPHSVAELSQQPAKGEVYLITEATAMGEHNLVHSVLEAERRRAACNASMPRSRFVCVLVKVLEWYGAYVAFNELAQ